MLTDAPPTTARVGTIRGRHDMPVGQYLVDYVDPSLLGQPAYDLVFVEMLHLCDLLAKEGVDTVEIYYTGLTEATIGAIDGVAAFTQRTGKPMQSVLMRYDSYAKQYERLKRRS